MLGVLILGVPMLGVPMLGVSGAQKRKHERSRSGEDEEATRTTVKM